MIILLVLVVLAVAWVLTPPPAASTGSPREARARHVRAGTLDIARMIERLATVISTGATQRSAWKAVAQSLPESDLAELARAIAAGADPRRAGPARLAGTEVIRSLGAALTVCERTGAPTAVVLQNLAEALRDLHDASLARRTAFAGPRSTAKILLVLPLAGLGLGMLLGGDPLRLLVSTPIGHLLAAVGAGATVIGWWWMHRLIRRADPPDALQVDPSVLLELIAGALESGLPLSRSVAAVAGALDPGPETSALSRLGSALEAGIPTPVATHGLPDGLAPLGESAVLAESSGADLGRVLRSAARDTRRGRARQAEERAAHLAVRLVLPTGVALLPAFVVLGIVPTVMSLLGGTVTIAATSLVAP